MDATTGQRTSEEYVSLFTNEPYDANKYSADQLNRLGKGTYTDGGDPLFAIGPKFVTESMTGNFNHAIVVAMGCDGLRSNTTAQAFLDKGASAFVSWTKPVSGPHTDQATAKFLQHLLIDKESVQDAVQQTANEVGPDPPILNGELRVLTLPPPFSPLDRVAQILLHSLAFLFCILAPPLRAWFSANRLGQLSRRADSPQSRDLDLTSVSQESFNVRFRDEGQNEH